MQIGNFLLAIAADAANGKGKDAKVPQVPLDQSAQKVAEAVSDEERQLPDRLRELAESMLAGNEVWRYLFLIATVLVLLAIGRLARAALNASARRFDARGRGLLATMCRALGKSCGLGSLLVGVQVGIFFLKIDSQTSDTIGGMLFVLAIGYVGYCLVAVVDHWLRGLSSVGASQLDQMLVPLVSATLRLTIGVLVLLTIGSFYKPMTSLIAGLGIGGLAIGLAAQDTLKNFFGSLMIFSDRPFDLGDEIRVDAIGGTVESVGFRSTRLRTSDGFLVTISNGELANKTIINVSKRPSLFRQITLPLSYDQPPGKLSRAAEIVAEILHDHEGSRATNPPRVFVGEFTPSAINLAISFWYFPADWWRFCAFNQRTNLEILRRFAAEEIRLAYPTQTIRLLHADAAGSDGAAEALGPAEPAATDPAATAPSEGKAGGGSKRARPKD